MNFLECYAIAFRESLEAMLIVMALAGGLIKRQDKLAICFGAVASIVIAFTSWHIFHRHFFEKVSAQTIVYAYLVVVILLFFTTNWFFHKAYWISWIARFHKLKANAKKTDKCRFALLASSQCFVRD